MGEVDAAAEEEEEGVVAAAVEGEVEGEVKTPPSLYQRISVNCSGTARCRLDWATA